MTDGGTLRERLAQVVPVETVDRAADAVADWLQALSVLLLPGAGEEHLEPIEALTLADIATYVRERRGV